LVSSRLLGPPRRRRVRAFFASFAYFATVNSSGDGAWPASGLLGPGLHQAVAFENLTSKPQTISRDVAAELVALFLAVQAPGAGLPDGTKQTVGDLVAAGVPEDVAG